jgi:hypothetical protein
VLTELSINSQVNYQIDAFHSCNNVYHTIRALDQTFVFNERSIGSGMRARQVRLQR